jgi:regulator of RNase E activity RraB
MTDTTSILAPVLEQSSDPDAFPYEHFNNNDNFLAVYSRLIKQLLYDREYDIIDLLESCKCEYDCKCTMMCDCDPEFIDDDKCEFVKYKSLLDHWDKETKYIRERMLWNIRQHHPYFPHTNAYGYYNVCDTYLPGVQKTFPGVTNYLEFREIIEKGYSQMCIRIAKKLKFPMALVKINYSSFEEILDLLHYSYCTHNKRKKSKAKAEYDEEGNMI